MKRTIACLLACLLMLPGMLVYVSAEEDSIFTYDDSKAYVPNVILMTFKYNFGGPHYYPGNDWGSGAFGDVEPYIQNLKLVEDYEVVENDTCYTYYDDIDNGALRLYVDHDYVAKDYPWSVEDFPELDAKSVQAKRGTLFKTYVYLKLNGSSKDALIDAAQKLAKRYEFLRIAYTTWDGVVPVDPIDTTDDTTGSGETTVPVTDEQTTDSAAAETTGTPEKPTSPPTGDAGIYAACVLAAAVVGVVGVVVYRRRRAA